MKNSKRFEDFFLERIDEVDFEKAWLKKFEKSLNKYIGEDLSKKVMMGSEWINEKSTNKGIIEWTKKAILKLDTNEAYDKKVNVMTECACQFPKERLQKMKVTYAETKDVKLVHKMLQEQFEGDLKAFLNLEEDEIAVIRKMGWGVAGILTEKMIITIKMPAKYQEYVNSNDQTLKKYYYCHCHRVKASIMRENEEIAPLYCYCGAGFYKGIWEEILQKPVRVEVLNTVLQEHDVCKFAIYLPD